MRVRARVCARARVCVCVCVACGARAVAHCDVGCGVTCGVPPRGMFVRDRAHGACVELRVLYNMNKVHVSGGYYTDNARRPAGHTRAMERERFRRARALPRGSPPGRRVPFVAATRGGAVCADVGRGPIMDI